VNVAPPAVNRDLRRRLGQYFTGSKLSRLLAELADASTATSAIDPMAGSGDMLAAVIETGAPLTRLGAIEIEPSAFEQCDERLAQIAPASTQVVTEHGNAFDPATWEGLQAAPWDLVITNPPYVRYQRSTEASSGDLDVPSANAVRAGLGDVIAHLGYLDPEYRLALQEVTRAYSGLADLAVPSWILCAALVKPGGTLAMLVPDTWLSREYATPLSALLDRFFDVEFVIHDADADWFTDASVRTTLFVARRHGTDAESGERGSGALHVRVDHRAASKDSLVGGAFPDSVAPEAAFAEVVRTWRETGTGPELPGCIFELPIADEHAPKSETAVSGPALPSPLRSIVASRSPSMVTLEDLGWHVGQGLRTGANVFFYGSAEGESEDQELLRVDRKVGGGVLPVAPELALPVVRSQVDLPAGAAITPAEVPGRVLALHGHIRPQDRRGQSPEEDRALAGYDVLPKDLADHLTYVESLNLGSDEHGRFVPSLSAVRPNARRFDPARPDVAPRFWYQLPSFAPRHRPDLCIPRVNYRHPRVVLNPDREVLIDANFSTLWRDNDDALDPLALLALLTSTWAQASMELLGTVLGGGALKLEATQLRRLVLPSTVRDGEALLIQTGRMLRDGVDTADTAAAIDDVVSAMLGLDGQGSQAVAHVAEQRLGARTR
jgi:hypothetical protein